MPVDIERMKAGPEWRALEPAQQVELLKRVREMSGTAEPAPAAPTFGSMAVSGARALAGQATQGAQAAAEALVRPVGSVVGRIMGDELGGERAVAHFRGAVNAPTEPSLGGSGTEPVDPTKSFGGKVGQIVGETAPFVAGGMAAGALGRMVGLVSEGQGPALLAALGGKNTTGRVLAREARTAVQAGVGAATAQEAAPDSKGAEVAGMLVGALGPEGARRAVNWAMNKIPAGYIRPITAEQARGQVGGMLAQAIPEGSVAEQGLNRAATIQERTGIKGPVSQATQSAGVRDMERSASRQYPELASQAQDVQSSMSEAVRGRVAATPGAGGDVAVGQEAVGRGLAADRAATAAPVQQAEVDLAQAHQQFVSVADDVERNLRTEAAKADQEMVKAASAIRPTSDGPELGDMIQSRVIEPARARMKAEVDRVYDLVDPANQVVLPTDRVAAALEQAKAEQVAALRDPIPELDRLGKLIAETPEAPFNVIRRWASALGDRAGALLRGATPDPGAAHILRGASEAIQSTLDDAVAANPAVGADVVQRHAVAKALYGEYADKFLGGAVAKVLQLGVRGPEAKIAAEDVGRAFFKADSAKESVRSLQQYFNAVGSDPTARQAIRDVALEDFSKAVYRRGDGAMDAAAGTRWLEAHSRQLREMADAGVDVRPEIRRAVAQRQSVDQLRTTAEQLAQQRANGVVPTGPVAGGETNPVATARQHLELAQAAAKRSVAEIDQSAAAKFVGADVDQAGKALLSGTAPSRDVAAVMRAVAYDPAAQRGIRQALLKQALDASSSSVALATGQPLFDGAKFGGFLDRHEGALRAAFGDAGYEGLKREHAIAQTVVDPTSPVTRAASLGPAEAVYTTQMILGRAYQGAKGFVAKAYLAGEVVARTLARSMNQFSNAELRQIYEQSLFDPIVARDMRALALRGDAPKEAIRRLRAFLGPAGQRTGALNQQPSPPELYQPAAQ